MAAPNEGPTLTLGVGTRVCERFAVSEAFTATARSLLFRGHDVDSAQPVVIKLGPKGSIAHEAFVLTHLQQQWAAHAAPPPGARHVVQLLGSCTLHAEAGGGSSETQADGGELGCLVVGAESDSAAQVLEWLGAKNRGGLPHLAVKAFARQALGAMAALHGAGVMHCDVKPANFVLTTPFLTEVERNGARRWRCMSSEQISRAQWRLIDMGSARVFSGSAGSGATQHIAPPGGSYETPSYTAPEMLLGLEPSPASDVWALACVLYELATAEKLLRPLEHEKFDAVEHQLWNVKKLLGPVPLKLLSRCPLSRDYFDSHGNLWMEATYRLRAWSLPQRLRMRARSWRKEEANAFGDFLKPLLMYDPEDRSTAAAALEHAWLKDSGEQVTANEVQSM